MAELLAEQPVGPDAPAAGLMSGQTLLKNPQNSYLAKYGIVFCRMIYGALYSAALSYAKTFAAFKLDQI